MRSSAAVTTPEIKWTSEKTSSKKVNIQSFLKAIIVQHFKIWVTLERGHCICNKVFPRLAQNIFGGSDPFILDQQKLYRFKVFDLLYKKMPPSFKMRIVQPHYSYHTSAILPFCHSTILPFFTFHFPLSTFRLSLSTFQFPLTRWRMKSKRVE